MKHHFRFKAAGLLAWAALVLPAAPAAALGLSCTTTLSGVNFGHYDPFSSVANTATGSVQVFCTVLVAAVNATITSTFSTGNSGSYAARHMTGGSHIMSYNLYADAGYGTVLGDGTSGTGYFSDTSSIAVLGTTVTHEIYGSIPADQNLPVGTYVDLVTVTVTFNETP